MIGHGRTDPPTAADRHRLREARVQTRARAKAIDDERSAGLRAAFREEIGAVVRSASPFLISLLAVEGTNLDDAVRFLEPQPGWPSRLQFQGSGSPGRKRYTHILRHYRTGLLANKMSVPPRDSFSLENVDDGWIRIEIVDHSIEVSGKMGLAFVETRFGELRFELIDELPQALIIACKGRLIEEVLDHAALRGRRWRIVEIEKPKLPGMGQTLVVATASITYRVPWAR